MNDVITWMEGHCMRETYALVPYKERKRRSNLERRPEISTGETRQIIFLEAYHLISDQK